MGMIMTLIIVADEESADEAMRVGRSAAREHPARILGLMLNSPRGQSRVDARVGIGSGISGERALIRLSGEVVKHPESVVLPLLLPDSPVAVWWPTDPPADPATDPLGLLPPRPTPSPSSPSAGPPPRRPRAGPGPAPCRPSARPTRPATPTSPGPG